MTPPAAGAAETKAWLSADECRQLLLQRDEKWFGLYPLLGLETQKVIDCWTFGRYSSTVADEALELRRVNAKDLVDALRSYAVHGSGPEPLGAACAQAAIQMLQLLPPEINRDDYVDDLCKGIEAMGREDSFVEAQSIDEYIRLVMDKTGNPCFYPALALFPGERPELVRELCRFASFSGQLADDVRDFSEDRANGRCFLSREEFEAATQEIVADDANRQLAAIFAWRRAASQWLATLAGATANRFAVQQNRHLAGLLLYVWSYVKGNGYFAVPKREIPPPPMLRPFVSAGVPEPSQLESARRSFRALAYLYGPRGLPRKLRTGETGYERPEGLPGFYRKFEEASRRGLT